MEYLENAYILSKITREDLVGKKEITGSEKYYLVDQGFFEPPRPFRGRGFANLKTYQCLGYFTAP